MACTVETAHVVRSLHEAVGSHVGTTVEEATRGALEGLATMAEDDLGQVVRLLAACIDHTAVAVVVLAAIDRLYGIWEIGGPPEPSEPPFNPGAAPQTQAYEQAVKALTQRITAANARDDRVMEAENAYLMPRGPWKSIEDVFRM